MSPNLRVPGHVLVGNGTPHEYDASGRLVPLGTRHGPGRAVCSCGAASPPLPSYSRRYKWMREIHKPEVIERAAPPEWPPERVREAMLKVNPSLGVSTFTDVYGKVQVTMSFEDLCSFAEWICGSMSEHDLTGFVKQELAKVSEIGGGET